MTIVSVDLETTGLDIDQCGPIQVGFAWFGEDGLETKSQTVQPAGISSWSYEAYEVNRIAPYQTRSYAHHLEVDFALREFLDETFFIPNENEVSLTALGWNVGSFDMQFIRKWFPNTYNRFHYRSIDLNSVVEFINATASTPDGMGMSQFKDWIKKDVEELLERAYGMKPAWHDAEYDAAAALLAYELLKQVII